MPLYKTITINETTTAYFWHITEDVTSLFRAVSLNESSRKRLDGMKSEAHQKGFLAVRMLLQYIGHFDEDLTYDASGKPHLKQKGRGTKYENPLTIIHHPSPITQHISISHSHEFSCICISDEVIGIDIELIKEKSLKIASRFMDILHLQGLSIADQITKATIVWGIKESIFKIKNEKGISFPEHIFEDKFEIEEGKCTAELRFNNQIEKFHVQFHLIEGYAFVFSKILM
ncbi:4'-phosphopantetheinyl transferase family protein [Flavobacterium sp.]|jgi:phosphopantetheinyl transferase|uniref:4'-phosphopantetheinyl transferase family protein n=1 Tax=Flavobacterium sp. TaxID=239 RepID=UPI0037BE71EA